MPAFSSFEYAFVSYAAPMHTLAVLASDLDAYEQGERFGRVLGLVFVVLLAIWVLFIARWSSDTNQGGFFFRLGVVFLPWLFAWGTLRSGFHLAARVISFGWMVAIVALTLLVGSEARRPRETSSSFRDDLVQGCVKSAPSLSESMCACLADAYVNSHSPAEADALIDALNQGETPPGHSAWVRQHLNPCKAQESDLPRAAAVVKADEAAPAIAQTSCAVSSEPPGAEVFVDEKSTGQLTPAVVTVLAGRNNLVAVKSSGFMPASFRVEPNLNEKTTHHFLLTPGVEVRHSSEPPGAQVFIDGEKKGNSPGTVWVATGHQTLVFKAQGCVDTAVELDVGATPIDLPVRLLPSVQIRVKTFPRGVEVSVDGKPVTGSAVAISADEKHFFTGTLGGFVPSTQAVAAMTAGDVDDLTLTLEEGSREQFENCVRKSSEALKRLQKSRVSVSAAANRAPPSKRPALQRVVTEADRELAARSLAVEACKTELHR